MTGIYSGAAIADDLREVFVRWGVPYAAPVAQTLIVIVVTYLTIVFGELIPKRIGMTAAEPVAKLVAGPMKVLSVVALPFRMAPFEEHRGHFPSVRGCAIPTVP